MAASSLTRLRVFGLAKRFFCSVKNDVEVVKETRKQRFVNYLGRIYEDYKDVALDIAKDMKSRPFRAAVYVSSFSILAVFAKTNPDEQSFRAQLLENTNDLLQLGDLIRNPNADTHMQNLVKAYNDGTIRRLNLFVCSVMWCSDYDRAVDLYEARCSHIKPRWLSYPERIVDIGFLGKWRTLDEKMIDFDINPDEWKDTKL